MLPNPSNISHILKISRYNYPATSSSSSAKEDLRITSSISLGLQPAPLFVIPISPSKDKQKFLILLYSNSYKLVCLYPLRYPFFYIPDKTRYLHYDNLGSIDTITDGQGNIVEIYRDATLFLIFIPLFCQYCEIIL
jgi:hypothetical protein